MAEVSGTCDARFEPVRAALAEQLESGNDLGASIAVDVDGQAVVDIWGGWRDAEHRSPWTEDTIVNVWSTTKTVTNLAALMLVDRGLLDPFAPVARYWPEFAENGKEHIERPAPHEPHLGGVRLGCAVHHRGHVRLGAVHQPAGRPEAVVGAGHRVRVPRQQPGSPLGELVRRVTGQPLKTFVADEIAGPLGADFQIGAAAGRLGRASRR